MLLFASKLYAIKVKVYTLLVGKKKCNRQADGEDTLAASPVCKPFFCKIVSMLTPTIKLPRSLRDTSFY